MSGYTDCSCRDCFEIGIDGWCWACEEAGCEPNANCQRENLDEEEATL